MSLEYITSDNQVYGALESNRRKKKPGCFLKAVMVFCFLLVFFLLSTVASYLFVKSEYDLWKSNFDIELDEESYIHFSELNDEDIDDIELRLYDFSSSVQTVNFITLSPSEFGILVGRSMQNALGDDYVVEAVYIEPADSLWSVYFKVDRGELSLPWLKVDIEKADIESVDLELSSISIGGLNLPFDSLITDANGGYDRAVEFVTDSELTNRELENIELDSKEIVIKSRKR